MGGEGGRASQPCEAGAQIQPLRDWAASSPHRSLESHMQDFDSKGPEGTGLKWTC